jgi:hypothetical protein
MNGLVLQEKTMATENAETNDISIYSNVYTNREECSGFKADFINGLNFNECTFFIGAGDWLMASCNSEGELQMEVYGDRSCLDAFRIKNDAISQGNCITDVNQHSIAFSWTGECVAPSNEISTTDIVLDSLQLYESNDCINLISVSFFF